MNPPQIPSATPPSPTNPPPDRLLAALGTAASLTWLADFLFWNHNTGISLAIYFCAMAAAIIALRWRKWSGPKVWFAAALMLAASYATAMEISLTNVMVLIALLAVIAGECWYLELPAGWARWSEPVVSWLFAPGRWIWYATTLDRTSWKTSGIGIPSRDRLSRLFQIIAPAFALAVVFAIVFGYGNAIFSELISRIANYIGQWILEFDFSISRLVFWLVFATLALAIAHPRKAPGKPRLWTRRLSPFRRGDTTVAVLQSMAILVVLNALFFMVNTIDVFYLWHHAGLPAGVNFSAFVHEGVNSLITAVLLSAVVITAIFHQEQHVRRAPFLKILAMLWIAQNLMLIAGVLLRLKLYVDAYQLTVLRVYVGCFLLLVTAGFALLAWHVVRDGDINALIFRNTLATFALFFVIQFMNVAGPVAHYNVARWKHDPKRTLDISYLQSLGPDAWPALVDVATASNAPGSLSAQTRGSLEYIANNENGRLQTADWRAWQGRRDLRARWLIVQSDNLNRQPVSLP